MSNHDELQTIDPAALAQVSGGATSTTDDTLLTALSGIVDSLNSLTQQNQSGGFNQSEMLMFMMMLQQRNQQDAAAVAALSGSYGYPTQEPIVRYY